jgi:hypothetical protein
MNETLELHKNPEAAANMAALSVTNYLKGLELEGYQEKRQWLSSVFDKVLAVLREEYSVH